LQCLLKQYNGRAELGEVFEAAAEAGVWEDTGDWSAACTARSKAPTETALWEQYCKMRRILVLLRVTEPELFAIPVGKAELDSSDIKRIIFTHELFETEMEDILYLLMWCLLMSAAECVTEGASSLVNRHADPRRHLGAVQYTQGAKVQSSGPVMAEADEFLLAALQRWRLARMKFIRARREDHAPGPPFGGLYTPEHCGQFLERLQRVAALLCSASKFLVILEDDVVCHRPIQACPTADAMGLRDSNVPFSERFQEYIRNTTGAFIGKGGADH